VKAAASSEPIVSAHDIVNRFGKQKVHDKVSLDILRGEIIGIAGERSPGNRVPLKTLVIARRQRHGRGQWQARRQAGMLNARPHRRTLQQGALFSSPGGGERDAAARIHVARQDQSASPR
jgi:phospholipid/cholesterol/gamma-HCH transport system ATP-binding protein